jgi:uncharacterized protein DUF4230
MRRLLVTLVLCALFAAAGAASAFWFAFRRPPVPDPPALVVQMQEVARLETLDVVLYKKITFAPDTMPASTTMGDIWNFIKPGWLTDHGKAIVFAEVHLGVNVRRLDVNSLRVRGDSVDVVLPAIQATVELRPGDTEVIDNHLDMEQTAQLLQNAKEAFEREALRDPRLQEKAKESAQRALRSFLLSVGFRQVNFVETMPKVEPG